MRVLYVSMSVLIPRQFVGTVSLDMSHMDSLDVCDLHEIIPVQALRRGVLEVFLTRDQFVRLLKVRISQSDLY